jgi:hypothetical protein
VTTPREVVLIGVPVNSSGTDDVIGYLTVLR